MALKVILFVNSLGAGGAERTAVRVCGWLRGAGHEVCLLTLSGADGDFYPCPEGVKRIALDLQSPTRNPLQALWNNLRRILALRSSVRACRAHVVVSLGASNNVLMLLALFGVRCRKIISERTDPVRHPLPLVWNLLRDLCYPMASLHVSQSNYVSEWLQRRFSRLRCKVIGNTAGHQPVGIDTPRLSVSDSRGFLRLIAIGRMDHEKGLDILLNAFSKARTLSRYPIELTVIGNGIERKALIDLVNKLGDDRYVFFEGEVSNVWEKLSESDIYVLPSRLEGFPNAMIEAMAAGLPVIAARCQGGVEDVLGDVPGRYALEFAPGETVALADAIVELAASADLRRRLGAAARTRASDYSPERIAEEWLRAVEG